MAIKIETYANVAGGRMHLEDREYLANSLQHFPDCRVKLTVEKDTGPTTKKQRGYYFAVMVIHTLIIMRDVAGYSEWANKTPEDAHNLLKYLFNPVFVEVPDVETGELKKERFPGTTKKMSKERRKEYIDGIIQWAYDFFNYTMPAPKRGEDKYAFSE